MLLFLLVFGWFGLVAAFFMIRPFSIPASSMEPNLLKGDYFLVSKAAYGISNYSLPYGDLFPAQFEGRFWARDPERGDLILFKLPKDDTTDYIKRVVGLPGDTIQVVKGVLTINGTPVKRERIEDYATLDDEDEPLEVPQYVETLPNGATYRIVERAGDEGIDDDTAVYEVPAGHVFAMGDNRDNSVDSRDLETVGYVPLGNLIGRPLVIFLSFGEDGGGEEDLTDWRWNRIFKTIH